ncbi:2-oxoacid:acceptor oxidoreductase family protein [Paradesulfitobacterium aromaticivorans]
MHEEIMIAGFGGQGVLSMGLLLAHAGIIENKHVSWIPSYGPEMRGGTANCLVALADEPISSPLFSEPSSLIVLNRPSLEKFEQDLVPGGILIMNSSLIDIEPKRRDIKIFKASANTLARERLGSEKVGNMILLGAYLAFTGVIREDSVTQALIKVLPEHRHNFIPLNHQALELGQELVGNSLRLSHLNAV